MKCERDRIKKKILFLDDKKWKADDYDVRYFLISNLRNFKDKIVLDVGGGIGIIESEMDESNFRVNVDVSIDDLKNCLHKNDSMINPICASMLFLPFKQEVFDIVISSHVIELAKLMDISETDTKQKKMYLNMKKVMEDKYRILKKNGFLFLTTPNFAYHKTRNKLTFEELNNLFTLFFDDFTINFFNTLPKLSQKRKLNFANTIPKIRAKLGKNPDDIIKSLFKKKSKNNYSVYFYAIAEKH